MDLKRVSSKDVESKELKNFYTPPSEKKSYFKYTTPSLKTQ